MPRVGSSKMSTCDSAKSHLATTTFCWLPPERKRTTWAGDWALMERASMSASVSAASLAVWSRPRRTTASSRVIVVFWAQVMSRMRPCDLRSSVSRQMPARTASRGSRMLNLLTADAQRPSRRAVGTEDGAHGLRAAGAHEPGDAHDLARTDAQGDGLRVAAIGEPVDRQQLLRQRGRRRGRGSPPPWRGRP